MDFAVAQQTEQTTETNKDFSLLQELNSLKCHDNFRLWLTAEVHPKFPTILLQSSLKLTYEVN